jgi:hypothetical protein
MNCIALESICIPSSVFVMEPGCFGGCRSLSVAKFEAGSNLRELGDGVFAGCPALASFCVPASVEVLARGCFGAGCVAELTFESPAHLRELGLVISARSSGQFVQVPGSVTAIDLLVEGGRKSALTIEFERDSSLASCAIAKSGHGALQPGVFVRFSEKTLKWFRYSFECEWAGDAHPRDSSLADLSRCADETAFVISERVISLHWPTWH